MILKGGIAVVFIYILGYRTMSLRDYTKSNIALYTSADWRYVVFYIVVIYLN